MLVLGRRPGENIRIGDDIKVIVLEVRRGTAVVEGPDCGRMLLFKADVESPR